MLSNGEVLSSVNQLAGFDPKPPLSLYYNVHPLTPLFPFSSLSNKRGRSEKNKDSLIQRAPHRTVQGQDSLHWRAWASPQTVWSWRAWSLIQRAWRSREASTVLCTTLEAELDAESGAAAAHWPSPSESKTHPRGSCHITGHPRFSRRAQAAHSHNIDGKPLIALYYLFHSFPNSFDCMTKFDPLHLRI